jgi:hypothetical protein
MWALKAQQAKIIEVNPMVPTQASQRVAGRATLLYMSVGGMVGLSGLKLPNHLPFPVF